MGPALSRSDNQRGPFLMLSRAADTPGRQADPVAEGDEFDFVAADQEDRIIASSSEARAYSQPGKHRPPVTHIPLAATAMRTCPAGVGLAATSAPSRDRAGDRRELPCE